MGAKPPSEVCLLFFRSHVDSTEWSGPAPSLMPTSQLLTAQRTFPTDWIAAYKKYCGVDSLQNRSAETSSTI
jgi:hypothetical protein